MQFTWKQDADGHKQLQMSKNLFIFYIVFALGESFVSVL